jgi:four helix bundle protein
MRNFRTYDLSVSFYRQNLSIKLPSHLKSQFLRAASSVALNLAEARGRRTIADQKRFFQIALGSIREVESIFDLHPDSVTADQRRQLDHLAASTYRLIRNAG